MKPAENQFPPWPASDPAASADPLDRMFAHMERARGAGLRARDQHDHDCDQKQVAVELAEQAIAFILTACPGEAVSTLRRQIKELKS